MKLFYSMQSELHEIYLMFLSQFNTLASEVKCLRVIERRDLTAVSVVTLGFKIRSYYSNYGIYNLWWTQSSLTKTLHRRQFIYYILL